MILPRRIVAALLCLLALRGGLCAQQNVPYDLKQALSELDRLEKAVEEMVPGDRPVMKAQLKKLGKLGSALSKSPNKKHPKYKECADRYNNLKTKCIEKGSAAPPPAAFDEGQLRKLADATEKMRRQMGTIQVSQLGDPNFKKRLEQNVLTLEKALATYPAKDPRVKKVAQAVGVVRRTYDAGVEAHRKNQAKAGFQEKFSAIYAKYNRKNLPPEPEFPMEPAEVERYVTLMRTLVDKELPADYKWLYGLKGNPDVDKQRLSSMLHHTGNGLPRDFKNQVVVLGRNLFAQLDVEKHFLKMVMETDPEDRNHIVNRLLGEGNYEANMKSLARCERELACIEAYDRAMGTLEKNAAMRKNAAEKIGAAKKHFEACMQKAYDTVKFPKTIAKDDLLAIAKKTLARKKYGVKGWERMGVTYDKKRKEKREGTLRHGTVTSTLTTYHYVWDEFGVTTAEKVGEDYYLFFNKFSLYQSGAETTPTDDWILSSRIQLSRIKRENIGK